MNNELILKFPDFHGTLQASNRSPVSTLRRMRGQGLKTNSAKLLSEVDVKQQQRWVALIEL